MGACISLTSPGATKPLQTVLSDLETGDVVWLSGKPVPGAPMFMVKFGSWTTFTRVGFVVREGPPDEPLLLCVAHQPLTAPKSSLTPSVQLLPLSEELRPGVNKAIAVSKLDTPLTDREKHIVAEWAQRNNGKSMNTKVALFLAPRRRLFCNQLVAEMLVAAGRVALVDNVYGPVRSNRNVVLQTPYFVALPGRPLRRASNGSDSFSGIKGTPSEGASNCDAAEAQAVLDASGGCSPANNSSLAKPESVQLQGLTMDAASNTPFRNRAPQHTTMTVPAVLPTGSVRDGQHSGCQDGSAEAWHPTKAQFPAQAATH